jgi:hypothetical protein
MTQIIAAISFVLMTAEAGTPILQVLWTGGCMAVLYISIRILEKHYLTKEEKEEQV